MEQFYSALTDILRMVAGEEFALKPLSVLSMEISALIGQADWAWVPYFLNPINIISLFVYGGFMYAFIYVLLYLPWRLLRALFPFGRRRGG